MKRIEISTESPAGRTVCALAEQLNLDPQDVLQGILFGLCNRRKKEKKLTENWNNTNKNTEPLAEVACNTWLEDSSVNSDAIMAILQSATNIKEQSDTDT